MSCTGNLHFDEKSGTCVWPDVAARTGCATNAYSKYSRSYQFNRPPLTIWRLSQRNSATVSSAPRKSVMTRMASPSCIRTTHTQRTAPASTTAWMASSPARDSATPDSSTTRTFSVVTTRTMFRNGMCLRFWNSVMRRRATCQMSYPSSDTPFSLGMNTWLQLFFLLNYSKDWYKDEDDKKSN